jgi:hypothetical protein
MGVGRAKVVGNEVRLVTHVGHVPNGCKELSVEDAAK